MYLTKEIEFPLFIVDKPLSNEVRTVSVYLANMEQIYYLYIALGIVFVLLTIILLMWRRIRIYKIGSRITGVVVDIRKTLVGGGKRGKPLAVLQIIDGPPSMIGQTLKIYTECIKLGRDPQRADMTFYIPSENSSISGLHARIERVNHAWRIVAVSQSGSETFVNDIAIPFNEPYPLINSQIVRLGYLAQQSLTFEFNTITATTSSSRKPEIAHENKNVVGTTPSVISLKIPEKKPPIKPQDDDDIFIEFKNR